jgi:hypothetical protein
MLAVNSGGYLPLSTSLFFVSSQAVSRRLGDLFNFVWTTAAALWNLRSQVKGFVETVGHADHYQLNDRFVKGSGITSADLITTCLKTTWHGQEEQLAKFVLFELCAIYEAWLDDVVPRAVPNTRVQEVVKSLQFPTRPGAHYSLRRAIQVVNSRRSAVMKAEFFPILKANSKIPGATSRICWWRIDILKKLEIR